MTRIEVGRAALEVRMAAGAGRPGWTPALDVLGTAPVRFEVRRWADGTRSTLVGVASTAGCVTVEGGSSPSGTVALEHHPRPEAAARTIARFTTPPLGHPDPMQLPTGPMSWDELVGLSPDGVTIWDLRWTSARDVTTLVVADDGHAVAQVHPTGPDDHLVALAVSSRPAVWRALCRMLATILPGPDGTERSGS